MGKVILSKPCNTDDRFLKSDYVPWDDCLVRLENDQELDVIMQSIRDHGYISIGSDIGYSLSYEDIMDVNNPNPTFNAAAFLGPKCRHGERGKCGKCRDSYLLKFAHKQAIIQDNRMDARIKKIKDIIDTPRCIINFKCLLSQRVNRYIPSHIRARSRKAELEQRPIKRWVMSDGTVHYDE